MFLIKNKIKSLSKKIFGNMGIKKKIFIVSITGIIIGFFILYAMLYILLPRAYNKYQMVSLNNKVENLINDLESTEYDDLNGMLDKFSFDNGVFLKITSEDGTVKYTSSREGFFPEEKNNNGTTIPKDKPKENNKKTHNIVIEKEFNLLNTNEKCTISVRGLIRAKGETQNIIIIFLPVAIITIIVIAITISLFYSKMISKPLLKINSKAKKMSELDFSERIEVEGNDEIGELSESLNIMCDNLQDNISKLKEANEKLTEDIEKEREAQEERKQFIATISHELKSPITIISGQLQGMIYNIGKYKDRDKYLQESYEVTLNMEKLVLELLELSRRDQKNFVLDKQDFNLSLVVWDICRSNYYFIEDKKLNLNENIEEDVHLLGDKKLIKKAFTNIIRNAIMHSPEGESVTVNLNSNELIVTNTGTTIDEKDIDNIFDAFYRVDKSRNSSTGGTGLGLYIVKSILDKHELKYSIESSQNSVIFKVKLS